MYSSLFCQIWIDWRHVGFFLDSIPCHWFICLLLCQYHPVLCTPALYYCLNSERVMPPALFFSLRIALAIALGNVSFHSNPKEGQWQRMIKPLHNCTHFTCQSNVQNPPSWASIAHEPQAGFRKHRGTRDQIAKSPWITEKAREFQKKKKKKGIYFCFTDYTKAFDCMDHSKLWKLLQEMRIPDHLTCLLWMVPAAMKIKDACSLERKLWQT